MGLKSQFATDKNLEISGIELDYGDFNITIARAGGSNQRYNKVLEKKTKPHQRALQNDALDSSIADKLLRETYAETIVLGWEGVKLSDLRDLEDGEEDTELPCTRENVIGIFEAYPDLYADIQRQASSLALFRKDIIQANAGNS